MKKLLLIILLLGLTGCTKLPNPPFGGGMTAIQQEIIDKPYLKLKVPKDKILFNQKITIPEQTIIASSTGKKIIKPAETFVEYDYISDVEILQAEEIIDGKTIKEDLSKRTENSQHFKIGDNKYQGKFYQGQPFYKDIDKWFQVETATTTIEAWNEQNKLTVFENIKSFIKKFAGLPLAVMGTVTTFYPVTGDCKIGVDSTTSWATVHDATTGTLTTDYRYGNILARKDSAGYWSIYRLFQNYDTSAIGAGSTVTEVTSGLYGKGKTGTNAQTYTAYGSTAQDTIIADDFDQGGTTAYATGISLANWSITGYNVFTWNATGRAAISKTGITKIVYRQAENDAANSAPGWVGDDYVENYQSSNAGTAEDPYLTVTYSLLFISQPSIY